MRINSNHVKAVGSGTIIDGSTFDWESSVFHGPNVFKLNGWYFEFIADYSCDDLSIEEGEEHDFRIVLDEGSYYDYVDKNSELNKQLTAAYKLLRGAR